MPIHSKYNSKPEIQNDVYNKKKLQKLQGFKKKILWLFWNWRFYKKKCTSAAKRLGTMSSLQERLISSLRDWRLKPSLFQWPSSRRLYSLCNMHLVSLCQWLRTIMLVNADSAPVRRAGSTRGVIWTIFARLDAVNSISMKINISFIKCIINIRISKNLRKLQRT